MTSPTLVPVSEEPDGSRDLVAALQKRGVELVGLRSVAGRVELELTSAKADGVVMVDTLDLVDFMTRRSSDAAEVADGIYHRVHGALGLA